ncbi:Holliday junction ATP-dependent DNA helicase RuvB [Paraglaciecola mesophila]|uniref:Holliday junction ATP-dependent DNA helicase RuvB n=1 Tax=Paraglaciecola mesophila TaxID=197222 RepID=A0A857JMC8_9ALTE|nr:Holliday junction ATP-dependent DNA helicase RuvB [Paraglaciecola mesophila]
MIIKHQEKIASPQVIQRQFEALGYICSPSVATAIYLACHLQKPILIEGPPGVGKTELAKITAAYLNTPLIRMQCYEGLDESKALYEWKYGKQLLYTQVLKEQLGDVLRGARGLDESIARLHDFGDIFYSQDFLEPRPLLQALQSEEGAVLLVDEIDKADQEFEAFLLELLSDYQVSIPEIGTVKARSTPIVMLTSNNTRELGDALKRRCLHLYIPFPDTELESRILAAQVDNLDTQLREQIVTLIAKLRDMPLKKSPAVSETIDWAKALLLLNVEELDPHWVKETLNLLLKFQDDIELVEPEITNLLKGVA